LHILHFRLKGNRGDILITDDERTRLNIALLFLELIIDACEKPEASVSVNELAWAAHSYLQSVTLGASLPDEEAQQLFAKIQASSVLTDAKRKQDQP
jgi:hypothetical protein